MRARLRHVREVWGSWLGALGACVAFGTAMGLMVAATTWLANDGVSWSAALGTGVWAGVGFVLVVPLLIGDASVDPALRDSYLVTTLQGIGRGGRLELRDDAIDFEPNDIDRGLGARRWTIETKDVTGVVLTPRTWIASMGGYRRRVELHAEGDRRELLFTRRPQDLVDAIERVRVR